MNPLNYLAGGAALGFLAGFWDKLKGAVWKFFNLFVERIEVPSEYAHGVLVAHLIARYPRARNYQRMYGAVYEHQRDGRYGLVPYEYFGARAIIFWNGWWPFLFCNEQENKKPAANGNAPGHHAGNSHETVKVYSTLTFLRGTLDVEAVLGEACANRNRLAWSVADAEEQGQSRFFIRHVPNPDEDEGGTYRGRGGLAWYQHGTYRLIAHRPEELGKPHNRDGRALDNLILPRAVTDLAAEIELWRNNKAWYAAKGIPWKRGWLLYGPPGTGKTALARAFAEDLNMPIYVFNLAEVGNHGLMRRWAEMQANVPCIALIEDIDNVFHGRENVARRGGGLMSVILPKKQDEDGDKKDREPPPPLTFDCLLNCLDGVERSEGVFTIITTNCIEKVDPALGQPRRLPDGRVEFISTRPGRIDKAVELTYMEAEDKKRLARRILGDYPEEYRKMLAFVDRYPELEETPAQFQERCGQVALACFWKEKQAAAAAWEAGSAWRGDGPHGADREELLEAGERA